jgi:DNA-binding NarL/FixJ family response regulator
MPEPIRVLVADDHPLFRRGLVGLLSEEPGFAVVGEASSGPEALELSAQRRPDVVLLDVHMPQGAGLEVVPALKQKLGVRVLILTVSDRDEDLLGAIEAGADGYLLKSAEPNELSQAIRQVAAGQSVLSPEVTRSVMQAAAHAQDRQPPVNLSDREREVLAELARGATTAEIAARLFISISTVKTHVNHILEKLSAANRAEAVGRAAAMGLLHPE